MSQWWIHALNTGKLKCIKCGEEKPFEEFEGMYWCNVCQKEREEDEKRALCE